MYCAGNAWLCLLGNDISIVLYRVPAHHCNCNMRHSTTSILILLSAIPVLTFPNIRDPYNRASLQTHDPEPVIPGTILNHKRTMIREALGDGWTMITEPGLLFMPVETSAAFLQRYFERAMAHIAASMLLNKPLQTGITIKNSIVIFEIIPITNPPDLTWSIIFHLAQFMANRAARGHMGTEQIWFRHTWGMILRLTVKLAQVYGVSMLRPCGNNEC